MCIRYSLWAILITAAVGCGSSGEPEKISSPVVEASATQVDYADGQWHRVQDCEFRIDTELLRLSGELVGCKLEYRNKTEGSMIVPLNDMAAVDEFKNSCKATVQASESLVTETTGGRMASGVVAWRPVNEKADRYTVALKINVALDETGNVVTHPVLFETK